MRRPAVVLATVLLAVASACARPAPPPAAAVDIPGLPGYPGARELDHSTKGPHWGYQDSLGRLMVADVPFATVRAFYERAIADNGWTVQEVTGTGGAIHWHLYRGATLGDVEIAPRPEGGVEIHLERHDHAPS